MIIELLKRNDFSLRQSEKHFKLDLDVYGLF